MTIYFNGKPTMRTIIAGGRECTDMAVLSAALNKCGWIPTVILSGGARGADRLGERFAYGTATPLEIYTAQWETHGRGAGYRRNELMASKAEALIALWDGMSRGTKHMITIAKAAGLRVHIEGYQ